MQSRKRSQIIYCITILAIVIALALLPFLYVNIGIRGAGVIKNSLAEVGLFTPVSGRIISLNLKDNQKVTKGTTLIVLDTSLSKQQNILLLNHITQLNELRSDIAELINAVGMKIQPTMGNLKTELYTASWQSYIVQFKNATNLTEHAEKMYQRYQTLYSKNVVTKVEFELYKFNYHQALAEQQLIKSRYKTQLQAEANKYRDELRILLNQKAQFDEQEKQFSINSSINGSIQNLIGLQEGTYLHVNQKIAEIIPNGTLYAYSYVKQSDAGLIRKGQAVRLQIDAFNYNQWGILMGTVIDISDDISMRDQIPFFKVKCKLSQSFLQLNNGYKGFIRKGMTFKANFALTKRSLYQLLYDKIDDWVN